MTPRSYTPQHHRTAIFPPRASLTCPCLPMPLGGGGKLNKFKKLMGLSQDAMTTLLSAASIEKTPAEYTVSL